MYSTVTFLVLFCEHQNIDMGIKINLSNTTTHSGLRSNVLQFYYTFDAFIVHFSYKISLSIKLNNNVRT